MTGAEIYAYRLSRELAKNNKVSVFYRINDPARREYEVVRTSYDGLDVYKINNTLKECNSLDKIYRNGKVDDKFSEVLDEVRPDIVHAHHLLFLSMGILDELKRRGIPVVFTLHDYWLVCPRGQLLKNNLELCGNPLEANCLSCLASGLNYRTILRKMTKFLNAPRPADRFRVDIRGVCGKVDLFISPSRFLRGRFMEFGVPGEKIIYSENGMDLDLFRDTEKTKSDMVRFGFIGTLIPSKGPHVLINAFNRLKGGRAVLKIYGKGPFNNGIFDYCRRIKRMAAKNKNIKFEGVFDNNAAAGIFKEIDALVFPSLWEENAPLVLREAALTKTPVIASDVGGVSEAMVCEDFLFRRGDSRGLFDKMSLFIGNQAGWGRPDFNFAPVKDLSGNSKEIEAIYKNLVTGKREGVVC